MTAVALALVELGHEGQCFAVLVGDLLGAVLIDRVVVAGDQGVVVTEGDLLLAGIALALDAFAIHAGAVHAQADIAEQRLQSRRGTDGVVDVVVAGFAQSVVAGRPCLAVGVLEHHELQLGADEGGQAALGQSVELGAQDVPRRDDHRIADCPLQIRHHQGCSGQPRNHPQSTDVGRHHHVAVAGLPTRHPVSVDGVHLHVGGEQIVTALRAVRGDLLGEQPGRDPFADKPALHVGEPDDHRVDLAGGHQPLQLPGRQQPVPTARGVLRCHEYSLRVNVMADRARSAPRFTQPTREKVGR